MGHSEGGAMTRGVCPPEHKHGAATTCYSLHRCGCDDCKRGNREREARMRRLKAYGRWDTGLVDADPVREHLAALSRFGIGWMRAAGLAGVSRSVVRALVWGREEPERRGQMQKRVARRTAERLLAVEPVFENLGDGAKVSARGTARRLRALVALGWSQTKLAEKLGQSIPNLNRLMVRYENRYTSDGRVRRVMTTAGHARAVAALFDELCMTPPPHELWRDRIAYARSKRYAADRGWPLPMDWEAGDIDGVASVGRSAA